MNDAELHPALRRSLFIAGTDTGVGKTVVSVALLQALSRTGLRTAGMKPVAAGAVMTSHGWRNDDALELAAAGNVALPYDWLNPCCLPRPTAPHLAALEAGLEIRIPLILAAFDRIRSRSEVIIVEGAGGWLAPIAPGKDGGTMQDVAMAMGLPVVLVVGIRLGCLNHALLTAAAIQRSGLVFAGWIANPVDPHFDDAGRYVDSLVERLSVPLLWRTPRVILPGQ
ncbi:MAG TPA: dethiobiotin synthase [Steroidobacteraceae bacterium]|nr:dethiobiotin synthase [Steroidobacteraceae bacterium]